MPIKSSGYAPTWVPRGYTASPDVPKGDGDLLDPGRLEEKIANVVRGNPESFKGSAATIADYIWTQAHSYDTPLNPANILDLARPGLSARDTVTVAYFLKKKLEEQKANNPQD